MEKLWSEGKIGTMTVKNRTVRSATNDHLATREGELTQAWQDSYVELAAGGVGLIITGQFSVDGTQRADEGQPILTADMDAEMMGRSRQVLQSTAEAVRAHGAKLVVQLSHTGVKAPESVNGRPPKAPADFTIEELKALVDAFIFGAKVCKECGVDGVQIHMAHGYLLSSFIDPKQNARTDVYGGSLENRYRVCGEIIRAVRAACGADYPILVKVDSNGSGDLPALLRLCKADGVDCAEVSGLDFAVRKRGEDPFYLNDVAEARKDIDLPICLVGGVHDLSAARKVMDAGIEFAAFARPLICQPDLIAKMEAGEQVCSSCVACNNCFKVYRQRFVRCVLHEKPIPQLEQVFGAK